MSVNKYTTYFITTLFLLFPFIDISAQKGRKELEREKQENIKKIEAAEKILAETESEKAATLGQLQALNRQIEVRSQLIRSISEEISYLNAEIREITAVISALENDLESLKKEYQEMIYAASKTSNNVNRLTFLFSSETFNQFWLRLQYLNQFTEMRKTQVIQIEKVRDALNNQKIEEEDKRNEQNKLLSEQINENTKLVNLKKKQTNVIASLNSKQDDLKNELESRKQAITNLDNLIATLIRKEMEKASAGSRMAELSASFEQNQAKLPWPVTTGFIASAFGKHPHPVLKGIMVENQGIDIQTQKDEKVLAVFDGQVVTKAFVPGMNNVVIIKHGEYYTLYAKLKSVDVNRGQTVTVAQPIGEVFTDNNGKSELQFQVWRNQQKMDPAKWLVSNK